MRRALTLLVLAATASCDHLAPTTPEALAAASSEVGNEVVNQSRHPQDLRMAWWREARFGLFIHWGLYAVPAGEWGSGKDHAEWIRTTAQIPIARYEELQKQFEPVNFDAGLWARTAKDAGMKYLVITSKHHDGFCLFDSKLTDWDVMGTPFHRDILAELSAACAREGIRFCTYHSIMDWHHPDYLPRREWEKDRTTAGADLDRFEQYLHGQVTEIVTKYHPGVMWFDGEWESTWSHERGVRLFDLCRKLDPMMIVNNRVDVHRGGMGGLTDSSEGRGDFATPEQEIPATGMAGVDWETCMTMNDHWGWNKNDKSWKSTTELVRMLVDIASKGGNFLLNIGPRPDGTFPDEAVERLKAIGAWMAANGESIRGTTASPFEKLAFGRCTVMEGPETTRLCLHVFDWPKDRRLVLPGLGNDLGRAFLLAKPSVDLPRARQETDVWIGLPEAASDPIDTVVVLEIAGRPVVYRAPKIEADADIFVRPLLVRIESGSPDLEVRCTTDGSEPQAGSPLYTEPLVLKETRTIQARAFHHGQAVSTTARARFERAQPRAASSVAADAPGLRCEHFTGDWDRMPDFDKLQSTDAWDSPSVMLPAGKREERVGLRFTGFLDIPKDDVWLFDLVSDDGSRLWIDGELVVDNDGLHGTAGKLGRAALAAGAHAIVVEWFNKTGGAALELESGALGAPLTPVTALRHAR